MPKTLYICYFGVREPLVETQVIPYLHEIMKDGIEVSLLTFEPAALDAAGVAAGKDACGPGIEWHWLRYHKWPSAPATAYDVLAGAWFIKKLMRREKYDVLHGRSHVPTLMAAIARKFSSHKPKLLFDIRGFFPEEYTDAGIWPEGGWLYRTAKRVEKWLMKEADGFVVLTEKAREILFGPRNARSDFALTNVRASAIVPDNPKSDFALTNVRASAAEPDNPKSKIQNPKSKNPVAIAPGSDKFGRPVEVIPCCVDLKRFEAANEQSRLEIRKKLGIEDGFVMAYVGSFGGWYLTEETADFYGVLKGKMPNAFALILTQSPPAMIEPLLRQRGYSDGDLFIGRVGSAEIPVYLSAADAAVSFIKPCYSKQASSPTKNAEYLASGLPIIVNDGVGDTTEFTRADRTGVVIAKLDPEGCAEALDEFDSILADHEVSERCRTSARERFDLENVGGKRYRSLYRSLIGSG